MNLNKATKTKLMRATELAVEAFRAGDWSQTPIFGTMEEHQVYMHTLQALSFVAAQRAGVR